MDFDERVADDTTADVPVNESDAETTAAADPPSRSPWLPAALIAVATLFGVISVTSTWVRVQALDTDEWVELSDELIADDTIRAAIATYLVDQVYERVDLADSIGDDGSLLGDAAGLVTAALRQPLTDSVDQLLASDTFRSIWAEANRRGHATAVAILRDETPPAFSATDGSVTLELGELVRMVAADVGVPESVIDRLPDDTGRIVIFESGGLDTAQTGIRLLDVIAWFLLIVVVGLYVAAVWTARGRRLVVLRNVGLSIAGAGMFLLFTRAIAIRSLVDSIVESPANRPLATTTAYVISRLVQQMAVAAIVYGTAIAMFAILLGPRRSAVAVRRRLAPFINESPGVVVGGVVVVLAALVWWSPGRSFETWISTLLLVALVVGGAIALRRSTIAEFGQTASDEAPRVEQVLP